MFNLILLILLFCINICFGDIEVNGIALKSHDSILQQLMDDFNSYSESNSMGVTFHIDFVNLDNSTNSSMDYESMLESYLQKGDSTYDLIFFENIYTNKLNSYLENLKDWLVGKHFELYREGVASQTCIDKDNKWIALPISVNYTVLYVNEELLKKYGQNIPTTWNDLIQTSNFILKGERILNRTTNLIGYNGLFPG